MSHKTKLPMGMVSQIAERKREMAAKVGKKFVFLAPVEASISLTVVLNWTAGLKR